MTRFPLDAVMPHMAGDGATLELTEKLQIKSSRVPPAVLADRFGVCRNSIYRWRKDGIPYYQADRVAQALSLHPLELWPNYYDDIEVTSCE